MEIELISTETVKPSKPTPNHLRCVKFSLFNHTGDPTLMPLFYFYPNKNTQDSPNNNPTILNKQLKESLSITLSQFYPLAGRIKASENQIVCNDEGVPYLYSRASGMRLVNIVGKVGVSEIDKLQSYEYRGVVSDLLLSIQVTHFECGGVVIGVLMNSKLIDAYSFFEFVKAWGLITSSIANSGAVHNHNPFFDIAGLFPPLPPESPILRSKMPNRKFTERPVTKRFVFDSKSLAAIRVKYSSDNKNMSLVLVLSSFIWSSISKYKLDQQYEVFHLVNLRPRMVKKLVTTQENTTMYFGEMATRATTYPTSIDDFLTKINESISKIDSGFLKKLQEKKGAEEFIKLRLGCSERVKKGEIESLGFSSLRSLPVYEADFGWGKPAWVTSGSLSSKNFVIFIPTRNRGDDDIEAYITLSEQDMSKLENGHEFISFLSQSLSSKL